MTPRRVIAGRCIRRRGRRTHPAALALSREGDHRCGRRL